MANIPGVTTAQGNTTSNPFRPLDPVWAPGRLGLQMNAVASAGQCVSLDTVTGYPALRLGVATDTQIAGILGENFFDPSALPTGLGSLIYAANILKNKEINTAATVHKIGQFTLIAVNGTVAYGDYVGPDAAGKWKSYGATNPLTNGAIVCVNPNSSAGNPIDVTMHVA